MKDNHERKIPQLCILSNSRFAQALHNELTKMKVLNRRYLAWHSVEDSLVGFPITRSLSSDEVKSLRSKINTSLSIATLEVQKSQASPRTILEALKDAKIEIPPDIVEYVPRAIDMIGDIGIIELEKEVLPYSKDIAKAFLHVNPRLKTILQKGSPIEGVYRTRQFIHLAGEPKSVTSYVENGITLEIDVEKVYFSPRLSTERRKVIDQVPQNSNEVVFDMFAGVGPFSVAIAKRGTRVIAVDINPDAVQLLEKNAKSNGVQHLIDVYQGDIRTIEQSAFKEKVSQVIMNLPSTAVQYLDIALFSLQPKGGIIHFYCFVSGEDPEETAKTIFQKGLEKSGGMLLSIIEIRRVKQIAPDEWQIAIDAHVKKI